MGVFPALVIEDCQLIFCCTLWVYLYPQIFIVFYINIFIINFLKLTYTWIWNGKLMVLPGNDGIMCPYCVHGPDRSFPWVAKHLPWFLWKSQQRGTLELVLGGFGKIDVAFLFFIFWPCKAFCGFPKSVKEILCRGKS